MTWTQQDYQFMSRALQLAKRGRYTCKPNPQVGCVIVRDDQILGEGWHQYTGEPHAEINALQNVKDISGSRVYVTLEPCAHVGRTPPCVESLIAAGVSEVIIAMEDPNPLVSGKGVEQLQASGIQVKTGLLQEQASEINKGFIKRMQTGLPYITCKMAMSLDGRTALANGKSQWISSPESRKDVHRFRALSAAIVSSAKTVLTDKALLTVRDFNEEFTPPVRVIIDREGNMNASANIFSEPGRVLIYTQSKALMLENDQTDVIRIDDNNNWLLTVFKHMVSEYQINNVFVECGAGLSTALIEANLIDELIIYLAARLLGSDAIALTNISGMTTLDDCQTLRLTDTRQLGNDLRLTYQLN